MGHGVKKRCEMWDVGSVGHGEEISDCGFRIANLKRSIEHGAEGYAVGGWRSAALEVGGRGEKTDDRGQKADDRGKI